MSAIAGPGPSTMAYSSPGSTGQESSPRTMPSRIPVLIGTPSSLKLRALNNGKDSVKGILRETGTPGSGNGVRFFPKNRFRVITPNSGLATRVNQTPPPPSPISNSFLSSLLAVAVPSFSPRRPRQSLPKSPAAEQHVDESWEIPGQEGEISLVASSATSFDRLEEDAEVEDELQEEEQRGWSGHPMVHSSPLGLTPMDLPPDDESGEDQREDQPSIDMDVPDDMSDLLMEKLSMSNFDSFSVSAPSPKKLSSPPTVRPERTVHGYDHHLDHSESESSTMNTSNPTVRKRSSLPPSPRVLAPVSPTPEGRPFKSIFADMSAEQADLSWPLQKLDLAITPKKSGESSFHSAMVAESPAVATNEITAASNPLSYPQTSTTPGSRTPGNGTEFFDCPSATPSPVPLSTSTSATSFTVQTPPSVLEDLVRPAKAVFDAHSAHSTAMGAELDLHRELIFKLQQEIYERDAAITQLNIRVLEAEMSQPKVEHNDHEPSDFSRALEEGTPSPSPAPRDGQYTHLADRTSVADAANRDLEIRLSKALADQLATQQRLEETRMIHQQDLAELSGIRRQMRDMEQKERGSSSHSEQTIEELRAQLETVARRERTLHAQQAEMQTKLEEVEVARDDALAREEDLKGDIDELVAAKQAQAEEIEELRAAISDKADQGSEEVDMLQTRIENLEAELKEKSNAQALWKDRATREREARKASEEERQKLMEQLDDLKSQANQRNEPLLSESSTGELSRLRSESASKDLEIASLIRRKGELKEDVEMLNIALDSKQQELELLKRRFSVRGIAGCTPLQASRRISSMSIFSQDIETPAPSNKMMNARAKTLMSLTTPSTEIGGKSRILRPSRGSTTRLSRQSLSMVKVDEENRMPA